MFQKFRAKICELYFNLKHLITFFLFICSYDVYSKILIEKNICTDVGETVKNSTLVKNVYFFIIRIF